MEKKKSIKKETNPKESMGLKKVSLHLVPPNVIMEIALGMTEGASKYGAYNYRALGVRGSTYFSAAMRHLMAWWNGEDIDPESGLNHIAKTMSCLTVMRDAMHNEMINDDRPPKLKNQDWMRQFNKLTENILHKYPNPVEGYTEGNVKLPRKKI